MREIALRAFERLDVRLLVDRDDERTLRRVEIEPDDLGRLGGKLGIVALAPRLAPRKVDLLRPQEAPDILLMHVAERRGDQRRGPARKARGRRTVENGKDALVGLGGVFALGATLARWAA